MCEANGWSCGRFCFRCDTDGGRRKRRRRAARAKQRRREAPPRHEAARELRAPRRRHTKPGRCPDSKPSLAVLLDRQYPRMLISSTPAFGGPCTCQVDGLLCAKVEERGRQLLWRRWVW